MSEAGPLLDFKAWRRQVSRRLLISTALAAAAISAGILFVEFRQPDAPGLQLDVRVLPRLDRKRRQAATKFRPSRAPVKRPVWENVERDQLGRLILVSGDCYRVLDDPNVTNYEIFREFQQFLIYCSNGKKPPRDLPWVDDIRQRYAYLDINDRREYSAVDSFADLQ